MDVNNINDDEIIDVNKSLLNNYSRSWNGSADYQYTEKKSLSLSPNRYGNKFRHFSPNIFNSTNRFNRSPNRHNHSDSDSIKIKYFNSANFKPYDAISNCKSAGIIPYTFHDSKLMFLFQKINNPPRKKDNGWNDFGGKRSFVKMDDELTFPMTDFDQKFQLESTADTAGREFSEETSCLFYLKMLINSGDQEAQKMYDMLKNDHTMKDYSTKQIDLLKDLIPKSQKYYSDKINQFVIPIHVSSKETYISYFIKVDYIPEKDLPQAEDMHVYYEDRYYRTCKWFTLDEIRAMSEHDFHKRLQITKIQQRINNYTKKDLF
jgi:hypothetical protein